MFATQGRWTPCPSHISEIAKGMNNTREERLRATCRVVVVNWNSGPRLSRCLSSIPDAFEVVVVDNASDDWDAASLGRNRTFRVLPNARNEGFAGAANRGAAGCTREFLLFLNPDVMFAAWNSADSMLQLLQERPAAAAVTGCLLPAGRPAAGMEDLQTNSLIRRLPTLGSALADILFLHELLGSPAGGCSAGGVTEIEQAPGACLLVRRRVFDELGGFDPSFYPAWFEDVDLCRRLRDRGHAILYQPGAKFLHEGGYSAARLGKHRFNKIYYGNMVRYFRKHHGRVSALVVRSATVIGNGVRRWLHHGTPGGA